MNILISNDDGYLAPGIALLARVAGEFANVRVVAPEQNRSAASNSLTLDRPLHIRAADNGFYFVNGTPTDCIHLALHALPDCPPPARAASSFTGSARPARWPTATKAPTLPPAKPVLSASRRCRSI